MKKTMKYLLKEFGINSIIALKSHSNYGGEFYASLKSMLHYKWTKEDIYYHIRWQLSMIKDYAQF
jgi:hypothetical protein